MGCLFSVQIEVKLLLNLVIVEIVHVLHRNVDQIIVNILSNSVIERMRRVNNSILYSLDLCFTVGKSALDVNFLYWKRNLSRNSICILSGHNIFIVL